MKKAFFLSLTVIALLFTACPDGNKNIPEEPVILTVQEAINKAENSITLNAEYTLTENTPLEISKAITVSGGDSQFDMKGALITVQASGVILTNLKNIKEIVIADKVADGDFTLSGCTAGKITVNGGGSKSVHIYESDVDVLDVKKEDVRIVLEKGSSVETTKVSVNCTLDSEDKNAVFRNVTAEETVTKVCLKGQTNIEAFVASSEQTTVKIETEDVIIEKAATVTTDSEGKQTISELKVEAGENLAEEDLPEIQILEEKEIIEIQEKIKEETEEPSEEEPKEEEPYDPNPEGNPYYIEVIEEEGKPGITVKLNKLPEDSTNLQYMISCTDGTEGGNRAQYTAADSTLEYYYPYVTPGKTYEIYAKLFSRTQEKTAVKTVTPKTGKGCLKPTNVLNEKYDTEKNVFTVDVPKFDSDIPVDGKYWINIFIGSDESKAVYSNFVKPSTNGYFSLDLNTNGDGEFVQQMAGKECRISLEYLFGFDKMYYSIQILKNGWYKVTPSKNPEISGSYITVTQEDGKPGLTVKLNKIPDDATFVQYFIKCYDALEIEDDTYFAVENAPLEYYYPFTTPGNTYSAQVQLGGSSQGMTTIKYLTVKDGLGCLTPTNDINPAYDTETNVFTCNTPEYSVSEVPADGKYSVNVCIGKNWDVATDVVLQSSIPAENGKLILDFNKKGNANKEKMADKICFITISYDFTYNGQFYSAQLLKDSYFNFTPTKAPSTSISDHMSAKETDEGIEVTIRLAEDEKITSTWGTLTENNTGLNTTINISGTSKRRPEDEKTIGEILNEKKEYSIVFPFVKEGNEYSFSLSGEYTKGGAKNYFGDTIKIKATKTNKTFGNINPQKFNKAVPNVLYDSKDNTYTFTTSYTKADFESDFGKNLNDSIDIHLTYFYGETNWNNCSVIAYRDTFINKFLYDETSSTYQKFILDTSYESEAQKKEAAALREKYGKYCLSSYIKIDTGTDGWRWDTVSTWTTVNKYPEPYVEPEPEPPYNPNPEGNPYYIELIETEGTPGITVKLNDIPADSSKIQYFFTSTNGTISQTYTKEKAVKEYYYPFVDPQKTYNVYVKLFSSQQEKTATRTITPKTGLKETTRTNAKTVNFNKDTNVFTLNTPVYSSGIQNNGSYILTVKCADSTVYSGNITPANSLISFDLKDVNPEIANNISGREFSFSADFMYLLNNTAYYFPILTDGEFKATSTHNPDELYWIELVEEQGKPGITLKLNSIPQDSTAIQYFIYCTTENVIEAGNDAQVSREEAYTEYYYPFVTPGNTYEAYVQLNSNAQASTSKKSITPKTGKGALVSSTPHNFNFDSDTNIITCNAPVYSSELPTNGRYWLNCFLPDNVNAVYSNFITPDENGLFTFDINESGNDELFELMPGSECSVDFEYIFTYNGFNYSIQFLGGWLSFTPVKKPEITSCYIRLTQEEGKPGFTAHVYNVPAGCTSIQYCINCINSDENGSYPWFSKNDAPLEYYYPFVTAGNSYSVYVNLRGTSQSATSTKTIVPQEGLGNLDLQNTVIANYDNDSGLFTCNSPVFNSSIPSDGHYIIGLYYGNHNDYSTTIYSGNVQVETDGTLSLDLNYEGNTAIKQDWAGNPCFAEIKYSFDYNGVEYSTLFKSYDFTPTKNIIPDLTVSKRLKAEETDDGIVVTIQLAEGEQTVNEWWSNLIEKNTKLETPIHLHAKKNESDAKTIGEILNEGQPYQILFPFVKAGTTYTFTINGEFKTGNQESYWGGEEVSITASKTNSMYCEVYPVNIYNAKPSVTYDPSAESFTTTVSYSVESFESDFGTSAKDNIFVNFGYYFGEKNVSEKNFCNKDNNSVNSFFYDSTSDIYQKMTATVSELSSEDQENFDQYVENYGTYFGKFHISIVPENERKWETEALWSDKVSFPDMN